MKHLALAFAGFVSLIRAVPLAPQGDATTTAPCAQVSQYMYEDVSAVQAQIPAKMAWDCLNSVPFNASSAKSLIRDIRPYINWQSTITQLANPPAEYAEKVQPPIDILGGLDRIDADIDAGRFRNEYDFGWTLYTLIQSAHDGHFSYIPDSVGDIFYWGRPVPLVSVSEDGIALPSVFVFADVLGAQFKNISYTPSPVVEIDGMDANTWLENWSQTGSLQDRDALYNNNFYELAQVSLSGSGAATGSFAGGGRGRYVYPGGSTTLKFANGTVYTMQNYARPQVNFRNITSGEDLAKKWFYWGNAGDARPSAQSLETISTAALVSPGASAPGYPAPVEAGPGNLINGFYIDAPGYEDVAVLQVPNFVGSTNYESGFQATTQAFIPKALAAGKTKLIIDLQANGGGTILQGYDLFKQLFPDEDPYGANRFRALEDVDLIGQAFSSIASLGPRQPGLNGTIQTAQTSWFDYHTDMAVDGQPFTSWSDKFGPVESNGDFYTTPARWNLSDIYTPDLAGGISITGYGLLANVTGPPKFKPENIVIVTDGYCASTCTIFAEFLTQQAGVKTIAMGGRSNQNPIQAIGGVKGVNNYAWAFIQQEAQYAVRFDPSLNASSFKADYSSDVPFLRGSASGVNNRDGLRRNDSSGLALQFIYEEADCRLFYTPEMTVDITSLWVAAADAQWGEGKCVSAGKKRGDHHVTSKLRSRRVQLSQSAAVKQLHAFEATFALETDCNMSADGFMQP
jgi:hypothetical protein